MTWNSEDIFMLNIKHLVDRSFIKRYIHQRSIGSSYTKDPNFISFLASLKKLSSLTYFEDCHVTFLDSIFAVRFIKYLYNS